VRAGPASPDAQLRHKTVATTIPHGWAGGFFVDGWPGQGHNRPVVSETWLGDS
jgi:hypothetical protein